VSSLADLAEGGFQAVIDDPAAPQEAKRVVVCAGKLFHEMNESRGNRKDVALVRMEQLYPFPEDRLRRVLQAYPRAESFVWAQEDPMNQGAWYAIQHHLNHCAPAERRFVYVGREAAAAPASGYPSRHKAEQTKLISEALGEHHAA
jgi:2-oxoglutarate dehydrogenase E1 component